MTFAVDAGVLIGLLDPEDARHAAATEVFSLGIRFLVHPVNLAEALIGPERRGRSLEAFEDLRRFGVVPETLSSNEALILARVRAEHSLRMPDACALAIAVGNDIPLITFDKRLAAEAKKRGLYEPVPA
ncbi:type II toxin-antitoxin system VapC family toxin [Leifsonia virtsii]|uniref:Ribonuclease VapC n=1 Tax=Leifsonia virtsii TaxID=3035915 RepID=A0ABT8ISV9_9MICO|nr:type II toxin-antitoxin system VapC family toxin [Leifsonia virtsii]MDN4595884.1 type II toxin-antitoxin system VapC family toxin [Leifsonia virtsii]